MTRSGSRHRSGSDPLTMMNGTTFGRIMARDDAEGRRAAERRREHELFAAQYEGACARTTRRGADPAQNADHDDDLDDPATEQAPTTTIASRKRGMIWKISVTRIRISSTRPSK